MRLAQLQHIQHESGSRGARRVRLYGMLPPRAGSTLRLILSSIFMISSLLSPHFAFAQAQNLVSLTFSCTREGGGDINEKRAKPVCGTFSLPGPGHLTVRVNLTPYQRDGVIAEPYLFRGDSNEKAWLIDSAERLERTYYLGGSPVSDKDFFEKSGSGSASVISVYKVTQRLFDNVWKGKTFRACWLSPLTTYLGSVSWDQWPQTGSLLMSFSPGLDSEPPKTPDKLPVDQGGGASSGASGAASGPEKPCPPPVSGMALEVCRYTAKQGETINVPVWLANGRDIANITFELGYDPQVAKAGEDIKKGELLPKNSPFAANAAKSGQVLLGLTAQKDSSIGGSGQLLSVPFTVVGTPGSRTPLRLSVRQVKTPGQQTPTMQTVAGEILVAGSVSPPSPPDSPKGPGTGVIGGDPGQGKTLPPKSSPTSKKTNCCGRDCDLKDALKALQVAVEKLPSDPCLDVDKSGGVDSNDAWLILKGE